MLKHSNDSNGQPRLRITDNKKNLAILIPSGVKELPPYYRSQGQEDCQSFINHYVCFSIKYVDLDRYS